jgi:hypothetical protein
MERSFPTLCDAYGAIASNMQRLAPAGSWLSRGSRAVTRSRVMVIGGGSRRAEVESALTSNGLEVTGEETLAGGSSLVGSTADAASEMASVLCLVALIEARTSKSRVFSRAVALAERHEKTIIPVVLDPGVELPDEVAHLYPMTWDGTEEAVDLLLGAIRSSQHDDATAAVAAPSIYISYVADDKRFVQQVVHHLRAAGLEVGYDETIVTPGDEWRRSLADAVKRSDTVLAIISPASVGSTFWRNEVSMASELKKRVIPVETFDVNPAELPYSLTMRQGVKLNLLDNVTFERGVQRLAGELRHPGGDRPLPPFT